MPTGYTAGIIDGKIITFEQFAKQCMRAFGATMHMRDDSIDVEYVQRTPSDYHKDSLSAARRSLIDAQSLSDDEIISMEKAKLEDNKNYYLQSISEKQASLILLQNILNDVVKWRPPTDEHKGLKDFMKSQIEETIKYDCNLKYAKQGLDSVERGLANLDAKSIREEMIAEANRSIEYHTREYEADVKRCADSNRWVNLLLASLS